MGIKIWTEGFADAREFFRTLPAVFSEFRRAVLLFVLFLILLMGLLLPYDHMLSDHIAATRTQPWIKLAAEVRTWGAFLDTITVTLLIFCAGGLFRRRHWRRLAVTLFLTASLSGIAVNVPRVLTGRPRPYVSVTDRWYGPVFLYPHSWIPGERKKPSLFQSFPSGHAAASVASAAMLLTAAPVIGIPMAVSAGGVAWSCIYANKHYATDVAAGAGFGVIFGVAGGVAFRRMRAKADQSMR